MKCHSERIAVCWRRLGPGALWGAGFYLGLVWALVTYWPGLNGVFLLDDFLNIGLVANLREPVDLWQMAQCSLSGMAGGLGRPISQLSFCLQYQSWPDAWEFKYVNLMLHLLNGCMLVLLSLRIMVLLGYAERRRNAIAVTAAVLWMLHPLFVSTVLYSVQRMTELALFFTLLGCFFYVLGRQKAIANRLLLGYGCMALGLLAGGGAATFSKENGLLLPLLVLVMEGTLFCQLPRPSGWRLWLFGFLLLPVLGIFGFIAWHFDGLVVASYRMRDFSLYERLLTESRVLWDYLFSLAWPLRSGLGLFHDDYAISRGMFDPFSSLVAVGAIAVLLIFALLLRRRYPIFSFAVLWFLAGHLLESTFLPLELYYEHRNYLPALGICFALAHLPFQERLQSLVLRRFVIAAGTAYLVVVMLVTWQQAHLWGRPLAQAAIWSWEHPLSKRAQGWVGNLWGRAGDWRKAEEAYQRLAGLDPLNAEGKMYLLYLSCRYDAVAIPPLGDLADLLRVSHLSNGIISTVAELVSTKTQGGCPRLSVDQLDMLITALVENPRYAARLWNLNQILGQFYAARGRYMQAQAALDAAFAMKPDTGILSYQIFLAEQAGDNERLGKYRRIAERSCLELVNPIKRLLCLRGVTKDNGYE